MENFNPKSVEEVFKQFKGRRTALLKALTTDFDEVYRRCDPAEKRRLCLIGHPGERWEVNLAEEVMHPVLPQPIGGINFARDTMDKREWLLAVALHSDTWLLAVAFSFSSRFGHNKADKSRLFDMINKLPTIVQVVSGKAKEPPQHKPKLPKVDRQPKRKWPTPPARIWKDEAIVCGKCNEGYIIGDLWVHCCECESSFHMMKCLNFTDQNRQLFVCSSCGLKPFARSAAGPSTKMRKF
ncbi:PREDICTED: PHD finger protein ALFIN-LIKE 4-like [Ipomoea nil]|uniref:PHD finger protein ALFIN-LIKE 4-like n=1 Tax=Ipomoea nil TaxID=35883 RepID=UPI0009010244|nr:PREDICTED: PHD finger protein ALFIN-LIKE 4-like [Ipomoea nil]